MQNVVDARASSCFTISRIPTFPPGKLAGLQSPGVPYLSSEHRKTEPPPMLTPSVACVAELPHEWSLIMARPRRPKALAWDLIERGLSYFLPLNEVDGNVVPMFDGYLFACGDAASDFCRRSQHVCKVDPIESKAAQSRLVRELSSIELVLFRTKTIDISPVKFKGQLVRVTSGPFEGVEGRVEDFKICGGIAKVVIGCDLLGQGATLEIEKRILEPI